MSYGVVCNFAKREDGKEQTMTKIYRVQMNSKGQPNFSTAVEIEDRPQGEWINRSLNVIYPEWERYTCSVCGKHSYLYDFCPHCGARMTKGGDDE